LAIGAQEALVPGKWWSVPEIRQRFPDRFDATSGHLPLPLMLALASAMRERLGELPCAEYAVPTGSGETIVALRWAYPGTRFVAVYDLDRATQYHDEAPLLPLVRQQGRVLRVGLDAALVTPPAGPGAAAGR